jgi:transposase
MGEDTPMGDKAYRPWAPRQGFLLPPSPLEWLPEGHLAYFILELVETLDLEEIERAIQSKDPRGNRPYSPAMMVALLLYAYCVGVYSSRKIERATYEDVAFRVLGGGAHPFFTTINEFRKTHGDALAGLFVQVLQMCRKAGLVKLGHVAIDGTKVQAAASKHKAMSYGRMSEEEARLEAQVRELLARADAADQEEDARFGEGQREEDLPEELRRSEERLRRIRQAKAELEAEARASRAAELREQAERARQRATEEPRDKQRKADETRARRCEEQAEVLEDPVRRDDFRTDQGLPKHRVQAQPDGTPHPKAQRNFVDPDSRIMESGGAFLQGYNCQIAVDEGHQVIVAHAVTNQCPDNGNLLPLLDQIEQLCEHGPRVVTADAGYWSPHAEPEAARRGTELYVAPDRQRHGADHAPLEPASDEDGPTAKDRMRKKLQTPEGRAIYARRKAVVEPVNGQIKEARHFRRFLVRGLHAVGGQWAFLCTAHNVLKLYRASLVPA